MSPTGGALAYSAALIYANLCSCTLTSLLLYTGIFHSQIFAFIHRDALFSTSAAHSLDCSNYAMELYGYNDSRQAHSSPTQSQIHEVHCKLRFIYTLLARIKKTLFAYVGSFQFVNPVPASDWCGVVLSNALWSVGNTNCSSSTVTHMKINFNSIKNLASQVVKFNTLLTPLIHHSKAHFSEKR